MQWLYLDTNQQQIAAEEEQLGELVQAGQIQADTMLWNETMADWQSAQAIWPDSFQEAATTVPRPHPPSGPPLIKRRGSKPATKSPKTGAVAARKPSTKPKPLASGATTTRKKAGQKDESDGGNEEISAVTRRFGNHLANQAGWMMAVAVMSMVLGSVIVLAGVVAMIGNPHFLAVIPIVLGVIPIGVSFLLMKAAGASKLSVSNGAAENLDDCLEQLGKYFVGTGIFLLILLILLLTVIAMAIFSPGLFLSLG